MISSQKQKLFKLRFLLPILFIFLLPINLYSAKLGIIPKIGGGLAYLSGFDEVRSVGSFTGGLGVIYHYNEWLYAELDVLYQTKGSQSVRESYRLTYFSLPLTIRARVIDHFSFFIGPQLGFLNSSTRNNVDMSPYTNSTDVAIVLGGSYYFPMGDGRLVFEFMIEAGLTDITKSNHPYSSTSNSNRVGYITIGYEFFLF